MKGPIVLLSGGLDSAVLLASAIADGANAPLALFLDYGQPALREEAAAASRVCDALGGALVSCRVAVPGKQALGDGDGPRFVPGRNIVFLSFAAAFAARSGVAEVWLGAHAGDAADYADCRATFLAAFNAMLEVGGVPVRVRAPFVETGAGKVDVLRLGERLGLDGSLTFSCYAPIDGETCNRCRSCLDRASAEASR